MRGVNIYPMLPYLLNHIGGRLSMSFAQDLRAAGISMTTWRVLHTLWHTGPLRLIQLAEKGNFDISTLSRVISDLETRGFVRRAESRRGRRPSVELSPMGYACIESLLPAAVKLESKALAALSPGERLILVELLHKLDQRTGAARVPEAWPMESHLPRE